MTSGDNPSRRWFLQKVLIGAAVAPLATVRLASGATADLPLLNPSDEAAKKVKYIEDASHEKSAGSNSCATCALYEGAYKSAQGPCQLFPGKHVKAAGWCSSWAPQI
jgi:hypothetical protein